MILNGKIIIGTEQIVGMGKIGLFAGDDDQMYIKLSNGTILPIIAGSSSFALDSNYVRVDGTNGPYSQFDFNSGDGIDSTGILNVGNNSTIVNIGGAGSLVNIFGTTSYISATDLEVTDKLITLNKGGSTASGFGSGFTIEEGGSLTGYIKVDNTRDGYLMKAPGSTWSVDMSLSTLTSDRTFTFPNQSGTIALSSDIPVVSGVYLPLSGGTMSGNIKFPYSPTASVGIITPFVGYYAGYFPSGEYGALGGPYTAGGGNHLKTTNGGFYTEIWQTPNTIVINSNENGIINVTDLVTGLKISQNYKVVLSAGTSSTTKVFLDSTSVNITSGGGTASLKTTNLTSDRTYQFPDISGTLSILSGTGTQNYLPKWNGTYSLSGTSSIYDTGSQVGIGLTNTDATLHISNTGTTGSNVVLVEGVYGQLFGVVDDLTGSLFSVNDISGLPVMEAWYDSTITMGSYQAPTQLTTKKITTTQSTTSYYSWATASYSSAFIDYTITSATNSRAGQIISVWNGSSIEYSETSTLDIGSTTGFTFSMVISGTYAVLQSNASTNGWVVKTILKSI